MNKEKEDLLSRISINKEKSILYALKLMDKHNVKLLVIIENNKLISLLSIGDIQRAIVKNISLTEPISLILREKVNIANIHDELEFIKSKMLSLRSECMPVVNENNELVNIYFWNEFFVEDYILDGNKIDIPVVIMAGGKGTRLKPLTNVLPKPLVPIDEKPIMQIIIENFMKFGSQNFYATVNYKAELIEYFFNNLKKDYSLDFILENKYLGTAGSLKLLEDILSGTFFLTNSDILVDDNYIEIYKYHKRNKYDITIVVVIKNYSIPYGVIELEKSGDYARIKEKPELTYMVNTGLYLLEAKIIKEIKKDEFIHITDLIDKCKSNGMKIGVFPISEASWMDIGQWEEYQQTLDEYNRKFKK